MIKAQKTEKRRPRNACGCTHMHGRNHNLALWFRVFLKNLIKESEFKLQHSEKYNHIIFMKYLQIFMRDGPFQSTGIRVKPRGSVTAKHSSPCQLNLLSNFQWPVSFMAFVQTLTEIRTWYIVFPRVWKKKTIHSLPTPRPKNKIHRSIPSTTV